MRLLPVILFLCHFILIFLKKCVKWCVSFKNTTFSNCHKHCIYALSEVLFLVYYLKIEYFQYRPGYVASIMLDVTHTYLSDQISESILHAYREVYFIHLKDNSVRMLHPDENNILARGNYEELVNRHFQSGKIHAENESQVRKFLSLQNIQALLLKQDTAEISYERTIPGSDTSFEPCLTKINVLERDAQNIPVTALILIQSRNSSK